MPPSSSPISAEAVPIFAFLHISTFWSMGSVSTQSLFQNFCSAAIASAPWGRGFLTANCHHGRSLNILSTSSSRIYVGRSPQHPITDTMVWDNLREQQLQPNLARLKFCLLICTSCLEWHSQSPARPTPPSVQILKPSCEQK